MNENYVKYLLRLLKEHHIMDLYFSNLCSNKIKNFNNLYSFLKDINPYLYVSGVFGWKNDYNWASLHAEYIIHSHANSNDDEMKYYFKNSLYKIRHTAIFDKRILDLLSNYIKNF